MAQWFDFSNNSNKFRQTYVQGFVDISGGGIYLRNDNSINLYSEADGVNPIFSIKSDAMRIHDSSNNAYFDISNDRIIHIRNLNEDVQAKLDDLTDRTQFIETSNNSIQVTSNIIPDAPNTRSLGTSDRPFSNLYVNQGSIHFVDKDDTSNESSISISNTGEVDVKSNVVGVEDKKLVYSENNVTKVGYFDGSGNTETLDVSGHAVFRNNLRVTEELIVEGALRLLGDFVQTDTLVNVTELIDISNNGTGPTLRVAQYGQVASIAEFYDDDRLTVIVKDGGDTIFYDNLSTGKNFDVSQNLTVVGSSSFNTITASGTTTLNGDVTVRAGVQLKNDNSLNLYASSDSTNPKLSFTPTQIRVFDGSQFQSISHSKLIHLNSLSGNVQTQLNDISSNTQTLLSDVSDISGRVQYVSTDSGALQVQANVVPSAANTLSLGSSSKQFSDVFVNENNLHFVGTSNTATMAVSEDAEVSLTSSKANVGTHTVVTSKNNKVQIGYVSSTTQESHTLDVSGDALFKHDIDVSGNLVIDGTITANGAATFGDQVTINNTLDVISSATVGGNLSVDGDITDVNDLNVSNYSYLNHIEAAGDVTLTGGDLSVTGDISSTANVYANAIYENSVLLENKYASVARVDGIDSDIIDIEGRLDVVDASITDVRNYVDQEISALIDNAPATLDTLREIADELSDISGDLLGKLVTTDASLTDMQTTIDAHKTESDASFSQLRITINANKTETDSSLSSIRTYIDQQISNVIDNAPAELDTLKELADELADISGDLLGKLVTTDASLTAIKTSVESNYTEMDASFTAVRLTATQNKTQIDASLGDIITSIDNNYTEMDASFTAVRTTATQNKTETDSSLNAIRTYIDTSLNANYSTITYVDNKVSQLVASAPEALDTLNELAVALGEDASFSTTIINMIGSTDSSVNDLRDDIAAIDVSLNTNYYTKPYIDGSLNDIRNSVTTNKQLVDNSFTSLASSITTLESNPSTSNALTAGGTDDRPENATEGLIRYNTDRKLAEIYSGGELWSGVATYKTEQPPSMLDISQNQLSENVTVTWEKFAEIYKDAFTGTSYPIYLQTFVDISFTNINGQSSSGWKTLHVGNGNHNSSGTTTTPLTSLIISKDGLNYNNPSYDISFSGKADTINLPAFTQDDTFDLRVYGVNNSGTAPVYILIEGVGLKTTGPPGAVSIVNFDTFTKTSVLIDTSFNLDSLDTSVISGVTISEYDISFTLTGNKSRVSRTHNGSQDFNNHDNKNNLLLSNIFPGAQYDVQIRAKNALNANIGDYGAANTMTAFTQIGNDIYVDQTDLNNVSHNGMSLSLSGNASINGYVNGSNSRSTRTLLSSLNSSSNITLSNASSFYINYNKQGTVLDTTSGSLVTASFNMKNTEGTTSNSTIEYSKTASSSTIGVGVSGSQYQFQSSGTYTDSGKTSNYSQGFVYSSELNCTNGSSNNTLFNTNFPASVSNYYLNYSIASTGDNNGAKIDESGNTSASRTTGDFYVDNYSGAPTIAFTSDPATSITANTFLFGIPSVTGVNIAATFTVSSFANNYIPHTGDVHSFVSAVTKNAYSMGVKNTSSVYQTSDYTVTYNETDSSITAGRYDANTTSDFTVNVYYLDNTGTPSITTHTDNTKDSTNTGKVFRDTTNTYSSSNHIHFFNGTSSISNAIATNSSTFATTYASNLNSALLYFNGRFVTGGYNATYSTTSISPFSNWNTGFAVSGPDYSSYANTGVGGFKWIALNVTNKKSGNSVNLSGFKINNATPVLAQFGSIYEAYISHDNKFGALKSVSNSGATLWYDDGNNNTIGNAKNINGALQNNAVDAFIDSTTSSQIYLIVGLAQGATHYFTFS